MKRNSNVYPFIEYGLRIVCFRVYDLNGDRYISKEEMYQMLKFSLVRGGGAEDDEDGIKDLVDLVLKKLDEDRDGRVSEADWAGAIAKESLLMEAFGQCLPTTKMVEKFLKTNTDDNSGSLSKSTLGLNLGAYATYSVFNPRQVQKTKVSMIANSTPSASAPKKVAI